MAVTKSCFSGVTGELGTAEDHEILIFTATLEPFDLQLHSLFVWKAQELSVLMDCYSQCVTNQIKLWVGHRMKQKGHNKLIYKTLNLTDNANKTIK